MKRRSIRLKDYDYSSEGMYFITICTQDRKLVFGDVVNGVMRLNRCGEIVSNIWNQLSNRFPNVGLDEFLVMPNHVHGIILVANQNTNSNVGAIHELPLHPRSLIRLET